MRKQAPGFTLVEVLVGTVLLMLSLGAAVTMIGTSLRQIKGNQDRLTATYLMQECLELTRNVRDTAHRQKVWHCPFFDAEDVPDASWQGVFDVTASDIAVRDGGPSNCQTDFGVTISTDPQPVTMGNTAFNRSLTVHDVQSAQVGAEARAQQLTATCQISWENLMGAQSISGSSILTRWNP